MKYTLKTLIFSIIAVGLAFVSAKVEDSTNFVLKQKETQNSYLWVDSVFNSLTENQRLAQLFIVEISSKWDYNSGAFKQVENYVKNYNVGGVIFFQGSPLAQAKMTNYLQEKAKTKLMIAQDGEWGLGMRLDSTINFPRNLTLGAIEDDEIIFQIGQQIGNQCNRMGVNIDFMPDIDIYNNPNNSVIGNRSFGENKIKVAQKGAAMMLGMQEKNVLTTPKHFPGHGNTATDSHKSLPIINLNRQQLDTFDMYPFKYLINSGAKAIMAGHIFIPSIDSMKIPASISYNQVTKILKNELNFNGLVFTDALNMRGVRDNFTDGNAELMAFKAGVDVFLMPRDFLVAYNRLLKARENGEILQKDIDEKCRKVLTIKYFMGLNKYQKINTKNLKEDLNNENAKMLIRKVASLAPTLIKNENDILPIKNLDKNKIACLNIGQETFGEFENTLDRYCEIDKFAIKKDASELEFGKIKSKLDDYNIIIIKYNNLNPWPPNFGTNSVSINFIENLAKEKNVILDVFNSPLCLNKFKNLNNIKSIIVSYEDFPEIQNTSAQMIFGGMEFVGKLPVSLIHNYKEGFGLNTKKNRIGYLKPIDLGARENSLMQVDSIINDAIEQKAFPGCQIMAVKDGNVFFEKNYGNFTYDNNQNNVKWYNLYDLASVTKVSATTLAIMKMVENQKLDINQPLKNYLIQATNTDKAEIPISDFLLHQSGLKPWIMIYSKGFRRKGYLEQMISPSKSQTYSQSVDGQYFAKKSFKDTAINMILRSPLEEKKYNYSDLGFYILRQVFENISNTPIDYYLSKNIYSPLGMNYTLFNPTNKFDKTQIAPTENDKIFRKKQIQGYVQDLGSAVLGGVSGHAGLFSNANDLCKLYQMLLNKGTYGSSQIFDSTTVNLFTNQYCENNRRGLGFDKNSTEGQGPASYLSSPLAFGHTGYTGTFVWADPQNSLIFIFLSNRVYPDAENKKILEMSIRQKVHTYIYQSIKDL